MAHRRALAKTDLTFVIITIALVATMGTLAIAAPPSPNSSPNPLAVYEELCSIAYGPPPVNYYIGTDCETSNNPVSMPVTYNLSSVAQGPNGTAATLREAYFAVFLASGEAIKVGLHSGAAAAYSVFFDNRTDFSPSALAKETAWPTRPVEGESGTTSVYEYVVNNMFQDGWYIFQMVGGHLGQAATLTFNIQPSTSDEAEANSPPPQG